MRRLLIVLGLVIGSLLMPSFAQASYTTYQISGTVPFTSEQYDGVSHRYCYYTNTYNETPVNPDVFTMMTVYNTNILNYNGNSLDFRIGVDDGSTWWSVVSTTSPSPLSYTPSYSDRNHYLWSRCFVYYNSHQSSFNTIVTYSATYNKYMLDGYSYYIDSNGFVHFIITQNTPNTNFNYILTNTTTGRSFGTANQSASSFEIVDNNPKSGATNIYNIGFSVMGLGGANFYTNINVLVPGDQATYNVLTQGANSDGKSLDATYDKANSAYTSAQAAQSAAQAAQTAATTASNQTWYTGTYGGSQESVASIAGYIRMLQL